MRTRSRSAAAEMEAFIGRHAEKTFDWHAFTFNEGYPELERAQMRYIGAGGSPKVDDPTTLPPEHFTLSMINQPVGKYASCHAHEVEESFLVLQGVLTVAWNYDGDVLEAAVGPRDLCLNASRRPHGFRNNGIEPVLCSITIGSGRPLPPDFSFHPRDGDPARAARFGAEPGRTFPLSRSSDDERHQDFARHIVRYSQQPVIAQPGFSKKVYVGNGGAPAGTYRMDLVHLAPGQGVELYARDVEDVYLVLDGVVTVGWEADGAVTEARLGPRDLIFNSNERRHSFRNDGFEDAQFMMYVGKPDDEDVRFQPIS